jgi:hypothetical protein
VVAAGPRPIGHRIGSYREIANGGVGPFGGIEGLTDDGYSSNGGGLVDGYLDTPCRGRAWQALSSGHDRVKTMCRLARFV